MTLQLLLPWPLLACTNHQPFDHTRSVVRCCMRIACSLKVFGQMPSEATNATLPTCDWPQGVSSIFFAVSCIDDQFQYGNHPICQSLSEYEPLVFGKVIDVAQHPLGEIVPLHKDYRWVAATCHCFPIVKSPAIQISNQIPCRTTRRLLVSCSLKQIARVANGRRAKKEKRVKEPKEKGLLLHPPLSHKPT